MKEDYTHYERYVYKKMILNLAQREVSGKKEGTIQYLKKVGK